MQSDDLRHSPFCSNLRQNRGWKKRTRAGGSPLQSLFPLFHQILQHGRRNDDVDNRARREQHRDEPRLIRPIFSQARSLRRAHREIDAGYEAQGRHRDAGETDVAPWFREDLVQPQREVRLQALSATTN